MKTQYTLLVTVEGEETTQGVLEEVLHTFLQYDGTLFSSENGIQCKVEVRELLK